MRNNQKTKKCICCPETNIVNFSIKKSAKDGLNSKCKNCDILAKKEYYKTIDGVLTKLYNGQKQRSKRRGHNPPTYTRLELKEWIMSQNNYEALWNNWIDSDYDTNLGLSVDRLDDYKGYTFENIQLMTWGDNNSKFKQDMISGVYNKKNKAIIQYDLKGNFIKEFHSINEASRVMKCDDSLIGRVCKNKTKTAKGFKWKYKEE